MNASNKQPLYLDLPQASCRRGAFRIEPHQQMPAMMLIAGSNANVKNLSANGIAFYLGDILQPDAECGSVFKDVHLFLGGQEDEYLLIDIEVLEKTEQLYRCRLIPKTHQTEMTICSYIVEHQKSHIRGDFDDHSEQ
ncbi:MAG: hypothetical protein OQK12_05745 [Motiliproteus sp.]|nr:hypothetical protein [Motiliproteus sp.]MCW9053499.1 hypothetical protein [Motiliproteus sp.]